ncbi:hypothetical protein GCM10022222_09830 [Amycolatopsis ultiminotia]|uniref:Uncharacterized protein n=1 Tax=Amycolatopsis ultiminotia TaxID=543629 RepID=A0ABP6V4U9_9PSEU
MQQPADDLVTGHRPDGCCREARGKGRDRAGNEPAGNEAEPNSKCSAIAPPTISAAPVATATISACAQNNSRGIRLIRLPRNSGSDRPVTIPSFAERYCTSTALAFATTSTRASRYP